MKSESENHMLWHSEKGLWGWAGGAQITGVGAIFAQKSFDPPRTSLRRPSKVKTWPAAPLGGRRPENFYDFGYGFAQKNQLARSPHRKKMATELARSARRNPAPRKNSSLAPRAGIERARQGQCSGVPAPPAPPAPSRQGGGGCGRGVGGDRGGRGGDGGAR